MRSQQLGQARDGDDSDTVGQERPLEERKLDHVHLAYGVKPRSYTSVGSVLSSLLPKLI